jgi:hypothetical protein
MWPQESNRQSLWVDGTEIVAASDKKKQNVLASSDQRLEQLSGERKTPQKSKQRARKKMPKFLRSCSALEIDTNITSISNPPNSNQAASKIPMLRSCTAPLKKTESFSAACRRKAKKKLGPNLSSTSPTHMTPVPTANSRFCTPTSLKKCELLTRMLFLLIFAVGFGLDFLRRMENISSTNNGDENNNIVHGNSNADNTFVLDEEEDSTIEVSFGRKGGDGNTKETMSANYFVFVNVANQMQTNYIVSVVFQVCSIVTLLFSALRMYLFPYAMGKDSTSNAPEAQLFHTLVTRGPWYETIWKILKSSVAIFDDVCVFVVLLVLSVYVIDYYL